MPLLNISEFSCLKEASFKLAPVNVIIGPQGSGKSVTTKLFYFFADITNNFLQSVERGETLDDYKRSLAKQFGLWFPPSAWGQGRFVLSYTASHFSVRFLRRMARGQPSDSVAISFSEWFNEFYDASLQLYVKSEQRESDKQGPDLVNDIFERSWRIRRTITERLMSQLGDEYLSQQTFIPAGRAFFTSIGRLVAGFEQSGSLDPITIKFARLFANLRSHSAEGFSIRLSQVSDEFLARRKLFMTKLFGGEIKYDADSEYVETDDGRKIPFASLSSGQQELLPMWSLLDYFGERDSIRGRRPLGPKSRDLLYIEEPEAHLFPSAQSLLMEFLIGSIVSERNRRSVVITTHSPYIMSKLNVFLIAGQLSRRKRRNSDINDIVPRDCWLNASDLSAFAIEDGELRSLLDEDGLIDGAYLDGVSEQISLEFSKLLEIESEI